MSSVTNIFKKFESEIKSFENHTKNSKQFKSILNSFFYQIQNLTVGFDRTTTEAASVSFQLLTPEKIHE